MTTNLGSALNGVHPPSAGFTLLQGIGGYSTTPRVLPKFLDIPRAAMIKMVYSTGQSASAPNCPEWERREFLLLHGAFCRVP